MPDFAWFINIGISLLADAIDSRVVYVRLYKHIKFSLHLYCRCWL